MTIVYRSLKPTAYLSSILLCGFAAVLGESAGLPPVFAGRLSADRFGGLLGRMNWVSSDIKDGKTGKQDGNGSHNAQFIGHNATFALTALQAGFNAILDDVPYLAGGENPAPRINRCSSHVLLGGYRP